jgi:ribonuclease J
MNTKSYLVYLPLGGSGEIGMNCYLYGFGSESDRQWIMVDCGMGFGNPDETPGVDITIPDVSFISEQRKNLLGIFLTHGHEDHIGALAHVYGSLGAPVYATKFVASLLRHKFSDAGCDTEVIETVDLESSVTCGSFHVSFLSVNHSIPETSALIIRTPAGMVVHSGDFKFDPKSCPQSLNVQKTLKKLKKEGVLCLTCDSTNIFEDGISATEDTIVSELQQVISERSGAVAVTCFASNVVRLKTIAEAAHQCGRKVVVVGRAMKRMIDIAIHEQNLMTFPSVIAESEIDSYPPQHLCYLITGSQGEQKAALSRIASGTHPSVNLTRGDTVLFSSKVIPGNERNVHHIWNKLAGLEVAIVDSNHRKIHVTGHACCGELSQFYKLLSPKISAPQHACPVTSILR